jgi:DNA repair ATPase RecN
VNAERLPNSGPKVNRHESLRLGFANAKVVLMSPRRPRAPGHSRQQIAQRLRDRRSHEERLILAAADALAQRNVAEAAVTEAMEALTTALNELQRLGFEPNQVAELLDVDPAELVGTAYGRRVIGRTSRPGKAPDSALSEDVPESDQTV